MKKTDFLQSKGITPEYWAYIIIVIEMFNVKPNNIKIERKY